MADIANLLARGSQAQPVASVVQGIGEQQNLQQGEIRNQLAQQLAPMKVQQAQQQIDANEQAMIDKLQANQKQVLADKMDQLAFIANQTTDKGQLIDILKSSGLEPDPQILDPNTPLDFAKQLVMSKSKTYRDAAMRSIQTPVQFGAQQTFKDEQGNLFFGTTKRNPSGGTVESILAPVGGGTEKPVGKVQLVSGLGLTAEEKISQTSKEAEAKARSTEKGKLEVQAKLLPSIRADIKKAETSAKEQGTDFTALSRAKAALPGLQEVAAKLKNLSDVATYTKAGQAFDIIAKELGFGATKGATARAKMVSIVDNQVLPLLRETFGAAFTKAEGDSLRASLLDVNATPEAKKATLDAFIEQKMRNIETTERQLGIQQSGPPPGYRLMEDANGNRAYVGPNGEIQEIR